MVTVLLKDHGISEARSIVDVIRVIERKATVDIHEYEFFKVFKGLLCGDPEGNWGKEAVVDQDQSAAPDG